MVQLPPALAVAYRLATDREVRSWSYGALKALRSPNAQGWEQRRGTLDEQGIFGPLHEFECACGKYRGPRYRGIICDRCGVKLTTRAAARRHRFGHIELPGPMQHPLGGPADLLSVFPVLPASFIESRGGQPLASVYEGIIRCAPPQQHGLRQALQNLVELILPIAAAAQQWRLVDAATLARGLALEDRVAPVDARCDQCGYPIEGLHLVACPHCGSRLRSS